MISAYLVSNTILLMWFYTICYFNGIDEMFKTKKIIISFILFILFGLPLLIFYLIETFLENKTHDDL